MSNSLDEILAPYDYSVPPELIAQSPADPRDSAKLLIYERKTKRTTFDIFHNIIDYLPENCVLVFNQTKVFPARMQLKKETGGKVGALYLSQKGKHIRVLAEGKIKPGDKLEWQGGHFFIVEKRDEKEATLTPSFPLDDLQELLKKYGETPLPPYIKESPLTEEQRRAEYSHQTTDRWLRRRPASISRKN